ncbi:Hypothetical predicted protein [Mytilus galloprovincialis]|uniref:Uncharacterized protein n=1 Tax=Mytilus galloprovincialis TaxID=29158 RepID=A0A8B6BEP1_MYTGA|nr:Hypothetical predicted protein [Mytilus galloprovincialis]
MSVKSQVTRVVFAITICYLFSIVTTEAVDIDENDVISELRQLITDIKKKQRFNEHELISQQKTIKDQANEIAKLKDLFHGCGNGTNKIKHNESDHEYDNTLKITNNNRTQIKVVNNQSSNIPHAVRNNIYSRQLQGAGIAFSVCLDHDLDLGASEVLKYNKVGMKEFNNTQILPS